MTAPGGHAGRCVPNPEICRGGIYPSREHSGCRKLPGRVKTLPYEPTGTCALWGKCTPSHTPARRGRACPARRCAADGRLRETCGPGMPGPYREAAERMQVCPESPPGGSRPSPTNRRERVPHGQTHGKPCTPHVGAGHARPGGVRRTGACGITCGPGMPGPYREPKTKTSRPNRRDGSFLCE